MRIVLKRIYCERVIKIEMKRSNSNYNSTQAAATQNKQKK